MPKAKYEGIYRSIKKRIEAQDYPYQSLLPSENTLIAEYDCSRNTVRRAIAELTADGYVQAMQGRGVRVIYQPVGKTTFTIGGIETFQETANRNHLQAVTRVIRLETITATEQFAAESGFSEGDELWAVQRVRYLDGKALILDINYFLKEFVPGLTEEIASHSIYDFIENVLGMQIITSKRRITVEHATARDEKLLDMVAWRWWSTRPSTLMECCSSTRSRATIRIISAFRISPPAKKADKKAVSVFVHQFYVVTIHLLDSTGC